MTLSEIHAKLELLYQQAVCNHTAVADMNRYENLSPVLAASNILIDNLAELLKNLDTIRKR